MSVYDESNIQYVIAQVVKEVPFVSTPVSSSLEYRSLLAQSLLYKCILACAPTLAPTLASAATPYSRPASTAQILYDEDDTLAPVGKALPKVRRLEARLPDSLWRLSSDCFHASPRVPVVLSCSLPILTQATAYLQASGEAKYVDDIAATPDTLYAAFILADVANATLNSVDISAVKAAPGVEEVFLGADLPQNYTTTEGALSADPEPLFVAVGEKVWYHGQAVGMVLASTQRLANEAASLAVVTYSDQAPPLLTIEDAIKAGSYFHDAGPLQAGEDIDAALKECDQVITGSASAGSQYHFHMEKQACISIPQEDGGLHLWCSTQYLDNMRQRVAAITNLPANKVKVETKRLGGSYGGKITRSWFTAAATGFAASKLNRTVRTILDIKTNMRMIGKRHPFRGDFQAGVKDGKLHAIKATWYMNTGAYVYDSAMGQGLTCADAAYYCPNWYIDPKVRLLRLTCRTNTQSNTATRAPGCMPAIYWMECVVEQVADALKVDPITFRKNNIYQPNEVTPLGMKLAYCSLPTLWDNFVEEISLSKLQANVLAFNKANRWRKRGLAVNPNKYGLGWNGYQLSMFLSISHIDGTITIKHGGVEMGQGSDIKMMQVVAYQLNAPIDMIRVESNDTVVNANCTPTGGSATSDVLSMAAMAACQDLNTRLSPFWQAKSNPSWTDVVSAAYDAGVDLMTRVCNDFATCGWD
ncbi:uncharacterized protein MONBRDRAFT_16701 [Monosiga brevicollis MX1]|uniref:Aldehyde oxidase/xanthine dehydrogenase a/b hammerhead domain-containing protein n=1 Tax=Monosiga brevicollis TaxID=81824 RepID=A9UXF9_MONBE|nr:uncharacterized protein MONBRDRAFT_16701 [Monosiga brevicollis MX1]EDQ89838.1 predicted protein [Monosiga brevicollis MX1]|eukprot:XP_001745260.1 hypothetical protein [Monosiga brevicollis MX1]